MTNLVNHSVTNLINGVSQQAPAVRLDNQLEEQINCFSDVTKGLTIRNGLELMNIPPDTLAGRIPIEFSVDDVKYVIGLDTSNNTANHIPMLSGELSRQVNLNSDYFYGATAADIRVVEDKDNVYLLNKKVKVASNSSKRAVYDILVSSNSTGKPASSWNTGEYSITISSTVDTTANVTKAAPDFTINILPNTDIYTISSLISSDTISSEVGPVSVSGNNGSYRLEFTDIPLNFTAPNITVSVISAISGSYTNIIREPSSGFTVKDITGVYGSRIWRHFPSDNALDIHWDSYYSPRPTNGNPTSYVGSDGWTYYRGPIYNTSYTHQGNYYTIRREKSILVSESFTPSISAPTLTTGTTAAADRYSDSGMIIISSVASNQIYTVRIKYVDSSGLLLPDLVYSVNIGTTVSNINIDYVASTIASQINTSAELSATAYAGSVYLYSTVPSAYSVTSIEASNNLDTSSILGVVRASISNSSAINPALTTKLPAQFHQNFKVRVSDGINDASAYYLKYDSDFKGWKESGLDQSVSLDKDTMPHIIDKVSVRHGNAIDISPSSWTNALAGDSISNTPPSFIGASLNDIFIYNSRLGLATNNSLVLSSSKDLFAFYRTTTASVLESDRVDIVLDSSKTGFSAISSVIPVSGKLLINTQRSQSVLLVNTAFQLSSARLSEVSSYSLGSFQPIPVNNTLYFALSSNNITSIYNYTIGSSDGYQSFNLTKHIPHYMNGNIKRMAYANNTTIIQLDNGSSTLYVQNRFSADGRMVQNAWHKWALPYPVSYFTFYGNNLYVFMTATDSGGTVSTLVCKYDIIPQVVTQVENQAYIGWTPYLDCYTKDKTLIENFPEFIGINDQYGNRYDSDSLTADEVAAGLTPVQKAYDSTTVNQTSVGASSTPQYSRSGVVYYWHVAGDRNEIVFNSGTTLISGNNGSTYFDVGGYRYIKGDATVDAGYYEVSRATITNTTFNTTDMIYGIPFKASITLSEVIPRQQGQDGSYTVMNYARLMLHRMRMSLANSGVFKVIVALTNRVSHTKLYTGSPLGQITLGKSGVSDINFRVPINGQSDNVTITLESDSAQPFNLLSTEWQGKLIQRGRNI